MAERGRGKGLRTKHGLTRTPEYHAWAAAKGRCRNMRDEAYRYYGGRGIQFSQAFDLFSDFLIHIGPRPSPAHSLDRIDNSRGYEPGNVRWATRSEQMSNRRSVTLLDFRGEKKTLRAVALAVGMDENRLRDRLNLGWPLDRAINEPVAPPLTKGDPRAIDLCRRGNEALRSGNGYAKGESTGQSKLTEAQVRNILADGRMQTLIALDYGVSPSTIHLIKARKAWKYLHDTASSHA